MLIGEVNHFFLKLMRGLTSNSKTHQLVYLLKECRSTGVTSHS